MLKFWIKLLTSVILGIVLCALTLFFAAVEAAEEEAADFLVLSKVSVKTLPALREMLWALPDAIKPALEEQEIPLLQIATDKKVATKKNEAGTEIADPTIPMRSERASQPPSAPTGASTAAVKSKKEDKFTLNQILVSSDRKLAVVNGELVTEGQKIGDSTVVTIDLEHVVIQTSEGPYTLSMVGKSIRLPRKDTQTPSKIEESKK